MNGMKENNCLLSICIPTYNRADYLIENLDVLIPQLIKADYSIELLISDNGSTKENINKIEKYVAEQNFPIQLFHHDENIGGRANFAFVVSKAIGRYIYLLGDDDILAPNFIEKLGVLLQSQRYSLLYFNFFVADKNLQGAYLFSRIYKSNFEEFSPYEFLKRTDFDPTFMSSIVFLKECWDNGLSHVRDEYYGYEWFAAICWGLISQDKPCLFYFFPMCIQRNPPRIWAKDVPMFKYLGQGLLFKDLDIIKPGLYKSKINFLKKSYYDKFLVHISTDPQYYRKYQPLFRQVLTNKEYRTLGMCLYLPFHKFTHLLMVLRRDSLRVIRKLVELATR